MILTQVSVKQEYVQMLRLHQNLILNVININQDVLQLVKVVLMYYKVVLAIREMNKHVKDMLGLMDFVQVMSIELNVDKENVKTNKVILIKSVTLGNQVVLLMVSIVFLLFFIVINIKVPQQHV